MTGNELIRGLPGEALIRRGLVDLAAGQVSVPACLVAIARPRLVRAGLLPIASVSAIAEPELLLYRLLREQGGDAYSRYNSLLRELASFEQAVDSRISRGGCREEH